METMQSCFIFHALLSSCCRQFAIDNIYQKVPFVSNESFKQPTIDIKIVHFALEQSAEALTSTNKTDGDHGWAAFSSVYTSTT